MQIIEIKKSDKGKWNDFVLANKGEFLQSWEWGEFQEFADKKIWRFAVVGEADEFLAVVLIIKQKMTLGKNYLYCPRGPVGQITNIKLQITSKTQILNSKIQELIFNKIREIAKEENSVFLKWEPAIISCHPEPVEGSGSKTLIHQLAGVAAEITSANLQPHDTLMLDLNKTEEELLAEMKQKTRYNIRLAEKHSVKVRMSNKETFESDFDKFWALTEETTSRDRFQSHSKEYYRGMMETLSGEILPSTLIANPHINLEKNQLKKDDLAMAIKSLRSDDFSTGKIGMGARLFLAEFEGKILAANIMVFFGDRATYLHGASGAEYRNFMAPYLLQWEQIKKSRSLGFKEYDFWGVSSQTTDYRLKTNDWSGITRFKTGFGGREINYPEAIDIIYQPIVYKVINIAKKVKAALK